MLSSSPNPTTFLLVRHARTTWNKEHRHTGTAEIGLAESAEGEIGRLTKHLATYPIKAIYSSPLSRCQITIAPCAEIVDLPVITRNELIERDLGSWEGRSPDDLLPTHPGYHFPESAYTGQFHITGAETIEHLEHRLRTLLNELHEKHQGETIALSTHSGVIWTILHRITVNPPTHFFWPGNCSIATITSEGNHYHFKSFSEH